MKRVNNADVNIKVNPKIVNVTSCNLKFYTTNAENFFILKTNEDITTVERECNGHTFNEYYIKLLWSELITLGEGVLQFIVLNSSKHVERTTEYYIDSNVIVPEENGETYSQILAELETKIDSEIDRSVSADTRQDENIYSVANLLATDYYNKSEVDNLIAGGGAPIDLSDYLQISAFTSYSSATDTAIESLDNTKLDISAYTPTDLTNYYTKNEVDTAIANVDVSDQLSGYVETTVFNSYSGSVDSDLAVLKGVSAFTLPISAGTGANSIIEGDDDNTATGQYSHAEGQSTTASGWYSHAEGFYTTATGQYSHAEGQSTTASSTSSHAEAKKTKASGSFSHAEGNSSTASGESSHAEGYLTTAGGYFSHAEGFNTVAQNDSEHASGQYNVSNKASTTFGNSGNTLFSVGNGTSSNAKRNAFEIRQNGDIYIQSGATTIKLQEHLGGGGDSSNVTVDSVISSTSTNPLENRAVYNQFDGLKLQVITLSAYNALQTKDNNTLYIIEE